MNRFISEVILVQDCTYSVSETAGFSGLHNSSSQLSWQTGACEEHFYHLHKTCRTSIMQRDLSLNDAFLVYKARFGIIITILTISVIYFWTSTPAYLSCQYFTDSFHFLLRNPQNFLYRLCFPSYLWLLVKSTFPWNNINAPYIFDELCGLHIFTSLV